MWKIDPDIKIFSCNLDGTQREQREKKRHTTSKQHTHSHSRVHIRVASHKIIASDFGNDLES